MWRVTACKTTSFRPAARRRGRRGFTLVEMLIAMGIGGILLAAVAALSLYTGRSFAALANYVDLDAASRNALDTMTRDVRQTKFLDSFTTNNLVFTDFDDQPLQYAYNKTARTLSRVKGGETKVLLRECDSLAFNIWQRNPVPGSFDLVPTTNPDLCKAIDVTWLCSRKILGQKVNTESVQTARIIIRKQQD